MARSPESTRAETAGSDEEAPAARAAAPRSEPRPRCTDGTCFACGAGFCPAGFYCDEGASGGAACSWVPACASASCECLGRALRGCRCESRDGGAFVRCD